MALTVGVCTRWKHTGGWRYLIALPAITVLHVNMQSAMWLLDVFLAGCFLLPRDLSDFKTTTPDEMLAEIFPLTIALPAMLLAAFVNPYGVDGVRYVIDSMGAASYGNVISEMKPAFEATNGFCVVFFAVGFIPTALAAAIGRKRSMPRCWSSSSPPWSRRCSTGETSGYSRLHPPSPSRAC